MKTIKDVQTALDAFVNEREWQPYQSPKNLVMALTGEVGELVEHFQWLNEDESGALDQQKLSEVTDEMADVFIYLVRLADKLDIDLIEAARQKIGKNAIKYPVEKSRGNQLKYTILQGLDSDSN
ncbi:MAG: nucleotide pyrophosphohydrolase [Gammaproteobacteria bacterium]|nr:nucleotide pyrophosphohydrolase [Gammaproteobacteria bacterium]